MIQNLLPDATGYDVPASKTVQKSTRIARESGKISASIVRCNSAPWGLENPTIPNPTGDAAFRGSGDVRQQGFSKSTQAFACVQTPHNGTDYRCSLSTQQMRPVSEGRRLWNETCS